ncbi:hypothetical protein [Nocardia mexicana]|uniref:Uncharacterized protein n=1 Tax=Nocardia mexicana TaxID=279262 RepID=A0A370GQW5_9NOCA|nr:hypothetical protein [Nocardia mexicana]RDI44874.1 hypothetical protein DFR68_11526 [Nocardia mexicana]
MVTNESEFAAASATSEHRTARPLWLRGMAGAVAAVATVSFLGAAVAAAATGPEPRCLWAGNDYTQSSTVVAGGSAFTCAADRGAPHWIRGAATGAPSTVANPGAAMHPAGMFSVGAVQPGTEYTDYCVGTQLVDGSERQYQVVEASGTLFWKAAGPISGWAFDPGTGPVPTTRSASLCPEDPVLWPQN